MLRPQGWEAKLQRFHPHSGREGQQLAAGLAEVRTEAAEARAALGAASEALAASKALAEEREQQLGAARGAAAEQAVQVRTGRPEWWRSQSYMSLLAAPNVCRVVDANGCSLGRLGAGALRSPTRRAPSPPPHPVQLSESQRGLAAAREALSARDAEVCAPLGGSKGRGGLGHACCAASRSCCEAPPTAAASAAPAALQRPSAPTRM